MILCVDFIFPTANTATCGRARKSFKLSRVSALLRLLVALVHQVDDILLRTLTSASLAQAFRRKESREESERKSGRVDASLLSVDVALRLINLQNHLGMCSERSGARGMSGRRRRHGMGPCSFACFRVVILALSSERADDCPADFHISRLRFAFSRLRFA